MSFERPLALLALLVVPALAALWFLQQRRRTAAAAAFANPALVPNLVEGRPGRRSLVPLGLLLLALTLLLVGFARPRATLTVPNREATMVLAIDVSRSMTAQDVRPTRLDAARQAAEAFLAKLPSKYNVAVVGIGTRAFVALPPTTDRTLAHDALESLAPSEGTAIGDAIALSTQLAERQRTSDGVVPPASVLVISDGAPDGGRTSPLVAARRARRLHVPISTVLIGTANGIVNAKLIGGYTEQIHVAPSPGTLQQIAQLSGGEFFRTRTTAALTSVFKRLATRTGHKTERREISDFFAGGALLLLLSGGGLSTLWFRRPLP
jgi:Ca-activated chloride channel family protein